MSIGSFFRDAISNVGGQIGGMIGGSIGGPTGAAIGTQIGSKQAVYLKKKQVIVNLN